MNRNVTATILIVLAAGIYFTVTRSMWASVETAQTTNGQYISAIANAQELIKKRDQVLNDYNNVSQADRDRLDKMLPSTVDNIRLIIDLNNVAVQHGLSLKNIHAAASKDTSTTPTAAAATKAATSGGISIPTLDTVDVSFSVTAPYQQFINFMADLESDLRIMDLNHLTVTAADNGMYSFDVDMTTYWLRQ